MSKDTILHLNIYGRKADLLTRFLISAVKWRDEHMSFIRTDISPYGRITEKQRLLICAEDYEKRSQGRIYSTPEIVYVEDQSMLSFINYTSFGRNAFNEVYVGVLENELFDWKSKPIKCEPKGEDVAFIKIFYGQLAKFAVQLTSFLKKDKVTPTKRFGLCKQTEFEYCDCGNNNSTGLTIPFWDSNLLKEEESFTLKQAELYSEAIQKIYYNMDVQGNFGWTPAGIKKYSGVFEEPITDPFVINSNLLKESEQDKILKEFCERCDEQFAKLKSSIKSMKDSLTERYKEVFWKMDESTVNWLKEHGYMKYADEPFEKWSKELDEFILKIRITSLAESKLYGMKLSRKAGRKYGPVFDAAFSVFFGNEQDKLDDERHWK